MLDLALSTKMQTLRGLWFGGGGAHAPRATPLSP